MSEHTFRDALKTLPFMNSSIAIEERVEDLLGRLTFEEKVLLSAGGGYNSPPPIPRLGIPRFGMTDGPHGVSPGAAQEAGIPSFSATRDGAVSIGDGTSTYFPTGIHLASTWNPELMFQFGQALAEELRAVRRVMSLGPAINICRSPMNGRTFEYYAEDPFLAGKIAAAAVRGLQSNRVAPCVKHFAANSQETRRFTVSANVSRRALEEIYFPAFRMCVEEADAWGIMSSYNKINGVYVSENKDVMRNTLMNQWGFKGVVVSDWGATKRVKGAKALMEAGLSIEMADRVQYTLEAMQALKAAGEFPEKEFEDNVRRILRVMMLVGQFDNPADLPEGCINTKEHQQLARKLAEEGMILLKNEKNLLPLEISKIKKVAILGKHADLKFGRKKLGGGSSAVYPPYEITVRQGIVNKIKDKAMIVGDPAEADVVVVCIGLEHTHDFKGGDHEGSDKLRYDLGFLLPKLVRKTLANNPNTIVIFVGGSPSGMEKFVDKVPAILNAWYGGMELGNVVADILFGDINPSGKLPVSWPKRKKDIPTALSFLQTVIGVKNVPYTESVFVGYRYYDSQQVEPRFCFGHGLSYTKFNYTNLTLSSEQLLNQQRLTVNFDVTNTGDLFGAEIAQMYVRDVETTVPRPVKELKGFLKVYLKPKERTTIKLELSRRDLAFFDEKSNTWVVEDGDFEILIGSSSRDIRLKGKFRYKN